MQAFAAGALLCLDLLQNRAEEGVNKMLPGAGLALQSLPAHLW